MSHLLSLRIDDNGSFIHVHYIYLIPTPTREVLFLSPFCRGEKWGSARLNNLLTVIWTESTVCLTPKLWGTMIPDPPFCFGSKRHQTIHTPCVRVTSIPGPWFSCPEPTNELMVKDAGSQVWLCSLHVFPGTHGLQPAQNKAEKTPIIYWPHRNHSPILWNWYWYNDSSMLHCEVKTKKRRWSNRGRQILHDFPYMWNLIHTANNKM